jgi:hypothetical protein
VTLIGSDGALKPMKTTVKFVDEKVGSSSAALQDSCPLVGVLDLTSAKSGCDSVNALLQTGFKGGEGKNAVCLDMTATQAVMMTSFDEMFSSKFCGAKGTDLCASVAETMVVVFPAEDLNEYLLGHEQTMRRIVAKASQQGGGTVKSVLFVIDTTGVPSDSVPDPSLVEKKFDEIWSDRSQGSGSGKGSSGDMSGEEDAMMSRCPVNVVTLNKGDAHSVKNAQGALASLSSSGVSAAGASAQLKRIEESWISISSGVVQPVLSSEESKSVYFIEQAYMLAQRECEAAFAQWYRRVGAGKTVGKFGDRVLALLESAEGKYMAATKASGHSMTRLRGQRRRQIVDLIDATASQLFKHQVAVLQSEYTARFRHILQSLVASQSSLPPATATETDGSDDAAAPVSTDLVDKGEEQQAIRQVLFEFRARVLDLEVERLGLTSEVAQSEFSQALEAFAKEFPESAFGRLEAVKKMEKLAKATPNKKKGGGSVGLGKNRAINIGLNLVGMLRPAGFGNLQGFVGYGTSLFGLPLDLLFGVQNDGDSPEIMGEDREHPVLRLQPKVHFDVDL